MIKVTVGNFSWPPLKSIANISGDMFDRFGNYSDRGILGR
jgi:hypothetical protein